MDLVFLVSFQASVVPWTIQSNVPFAGVRFRSCHSLTRIKGIIHVCRAANASMPLVIRSSR